MNENRKLLSACNYSLQLTFMGEEEKKIQNIIAGLLLWLYIIDAPESLKYTLFRLKHTLVSFRAPQFAVVGNVAQRAKRAQSKVRTSEGYTNQ